MLKKIISKPYLFFFGLVPLFVIIGLLNMKSYIKLRIDYLNFDLDISLLCNISAVFFLLIGFNYYSLFWVQKEPKKSLTITHIILQLISLIPFILLIFSVDFSKNNPSIFTNTNLLLIISFIIFLISVFIHLINFFTSLFLKSK